VHVAGETSAPYTRPFLYPDFKAALNYLSPTGATPAADGNNYRNYYSDAQRTDYLAYAKFDANLAEGTTWSNQVYHHKDDGAGVVAGPIGVAGLPGLFSVYYPKQNLKEVFGNSGYACARRNTTSSAAASFPPCARSSASTSWKRACGWNRTARPPTAAGMRWT